MINPDAELNRLRYELRQKGLSLSEVDELCDSASQDINELILDITSNAIESAIAYAEDIGAEAFISDMDIIDVGGGYMISTRSGVTNFSIPERKMLPDLVKNGKTSEDGNKYKVIPITKKQEEQVITDIFTVQKQRDAQINHIRSTINNKSIDRSERAKMMADEWRKSININMSSRPAKRKIEVKSADVVFRTASESQDPNTSWIYPAKDMDMTGFLMDLNKKMQQDVYFSVINVIQAYSRSYS